MKPLLTVFTPTYNRAGLLPRLYDALLRQSSKNFIWMIIDDGSTDGTGDIVREWMRRDGGFEIKYFYKENGGLYTGYNLAIEKLETELAVCIDSDDFPTDDAAEKIERFWREHGSDEFAGIEALDCYADGTIVGEKLPNARTVNLIDIMTGRAKSGRGDKKPVVRSALYKSVAPMEGFEGEKYFNPHYMHLQISFDYDFLVMNEPICVVEYQPDGMTRGIYRQYVQSPHSFARFRRLQMQFKGAPLSFRVKTAVHYCAECILGGENPFQTVGTRWKFLCVLVYPVSACFAKYIKRKSKI